MMRLVANQSSEIERSERVSFTFEGQRIEGHTGENLVTALLRADHSTLGRALEDNAPRGAFCMIGLCQECVVRIDGQVVEACRCEVVAGLVVERAR